MCPGPGASAVVRIFLNWMAGCLRPPPASSGEEAENRGVTAAQKPRQVGPSPALPPVTLFATAACRLIGPLAGHYPASLFAYGTPSHPKRGAHSASA